MAGRRDANACVTSRANGVEALQNASLGKELTRRGFDSIKEHWEMRGGGLLSESFPAVAWSRQYPRTICKGSEQVVHSLITKCR